MKTGGLGAVGLAVVGLCLLPGTAQALDLYFNHLNDELAGPGRPTGFYEFHGDAGVVFSEEVTAADRLIIESPTPTGLILIKALAAEPDLMAQARASLMAATCRQQNDPAAR